ncbi:hypothetical protein Hanom_Chr16g01445291 [Helianthus anomalus]
MTNSDSEFDTHWISESDEDLVDVEDLEEGEILHNVSPVALETVGGQSPAKEVTGDMSGDANESPAVNELAQVGEGAPTLQKASGGNDDMGNQALHGDWNKAAHVDCGFDGELGTVPCPIASNKNTEPNNGGPDGRFYEVPSNQEDKEHGPEVDYDHSNFLNGNDGPTPANYLGKRNRAERSPPLVGSVQGPSQRKFGESIRSDLGD